MPRVGEPIPPPPWFKENIANGMLPKIWHDAYPFHRCRCGHVLEAHDEPLPLIESTPCGAKKCPCPEYREDTVFLLPKWSSKPSTEIVMKYDAVLKE